MDVKTIMPSGVKFDDETGGVTVKFAQLGVKDHDGDVTKPGFFGTQQSAIAWAHDRSRIVGKGQVSEQDNWAVFNGKFFIETYEGEQAYLTTKAMGDLQEWSYGFHTYPGGHVRGTHDGQPVMFLQPLEDGSPGAKIAEVSPVLVGAGIGTHTVSIKSQGTRFVDHAHQVAREAELLFARGEEIAQMRAEKGTTLGADAVAQLAEVKMRLEAVAAMLGGITDTPVHDDYLSARMELDRTRRFLEEYAQ